MAGACLSGGDSAWASSTDNYQVTVHVDRSALVQGDGRSGLPIESVKRLCCESNMTDDDIGISSTLVNNPSAEGLLTEMEILLINRR